MLSFSLTCHFPQRLFRRCPYVAVYRIYHESIHKRDPGEQPVNGRAFVRSDAVTFDKFWGEKLSQYDDSVLLVYSLEPFESDFLSHGGPSAYPPDRSLAVFPSSIYLGWTNASADGYMADAMRLSAASLVEAGIKDGQALKNAAPYVNYALFGTPLETMYGQHLERLREIREEYDPKDVMGLAGGWKF